LSGQDDDFTMLISIAYTGMRWGETVGLERELLQLALINVEWQLRELNGKFHRLPPKDDSYRSLNWEPRVPVDLPPFLAAMLASQPARQRRPPDGGASAPGFTRAAAVICSLARKAVTTGEATTPGASFDPRRTAAT
jgi:hypothetical protein